MTFVVADRVQENGTVASGTGSVTLAGAVNGYQSFASGIGNNNTTYYTIYDPVTYAWEVGLGTVTTSPNTLARTTVYANSSGTQPSKISFSTSDTLTVFVTYPAEIAIYTAASASLNSLSLTSSITGSSNKGALNYGTLSYSDTNIFESYQTSVNSYAQIVIQNSNAGSAASADVVVSSDSGTATANYGDFGINSTGYTGTGPLNSPSMVYLYSQSYDLTIGTNTSNAIHFTINNAATDAMTINTSGSIAINGQTGSLGQVLISQGSSTPPSWGNAGGNLVVTDFTATAGQTTFSITYVVGTVSVYRNGIKLGLADFTATNGTSVVLATGAVVGDLIEIQSFSTLTLYSSITSQNFSGNGSTTAFTMNVNPANSASVLVAINGVTQDPVNYTVSGTTLTFSTAPATGTNNISVRYLGVPSTTAVSSFSAGTTGFSPTTAASGAVTLSGILAVTNGGTGLSTLGSGYIPYGAGTSAFNSLSTFTFDGSTLFSPNASYSGNLTFTGTASKILGDFSNVTLASRTVIQTSTTNGTTGVYVVPNGTSTAASIQALNAATPTNAAKILIATNGTTDVQLVSGINGSASYLPLSIFNGGVGTFVFGTAGQFGIGPLASVSYGTTGQVFTSGGSGAAPTWTTVAVTPAAVSDQNNTSTGYFGLPAGTTAQRPGSPAAGNTRFNTSLTQMEVYTGSAWVELSSTPSTSYPVQYIVVAGGGSGGSKNGGGGGAGGTIAASTIVTTAQTLAVTIGGGASAPGAGGANQGNNGSNSVFGTVTASGGGGGGCQGGSATGTNGTAGGCGGGAGSANVVNTTTGGAGTSGQGFTGGTSFGRTSGTNDAGGGGGGATTVGGNQTTSQGGLGGTGLTWINGSTYGGGGGGGGYTTTAGTGGSGGGGAGVTGTGSTPATSGTANTGGGGGGGSEGGQSNVTAGAGGSGIVVIAYVGGTRGSGGTITSSGGYTYHTFTTSGTFTA